MPIVILESAPHKLLRRIVSHKRQKENLNRDPSNGEVIKEALDLLAKKEKLK